MLSPAVPTPHECTIGDIINMTDKKAEERCLKFSKLSFSSGKDKSIDFEAGCVMDFSYVKAKRHDCQFRPQAKMWLVQTIEFKFSQAASRKISVYCVIKLLKVVRSATLLKEEPELAKDFFKSLKEYPVPEKEYKSKEVCFLEISIENRP